MYMNESIEDTKFLEYTIIDGELISVLLVNDEIVYSPCDTENPQYERILKLTQKKDIELEKSGHMYRGSACETADGCGNCDGGRCDFCKDTWLVDGTRFYDYEAALAHRAEIIKLIPMRVIEYTIIDNILCGLVYEGQRFIACNQESSLYQKIFEDTKGKMNKYRECSCTDKNDGMNLCVVLCSCTDSSCYRNMKAGKKQRLIYL